MEIASIADKIACTGVNGANTGKLGCLALFGTPTHLLAFPRGKTFTEFGLADIRLEVQKGNIIPIIGASTFEDVSGEDGYATNTRGVKRLNLKGLPEYRLIFEEGHEFYKELAKLEGFKNYTFAIGDDMGNWMMVERNDGTYAGFAAGHVTPQLTNRSTPGGDAERKGLLIQFLNRLEWDHNYTILHREKLGFVPEDISLVNGVNIKFAGYPAAGTSTLTVDVLLASDNTTTIEGLVTGDFRVLVDGEIRSVTAAPVADRPGRYTLTLTAPTLSAGERVEVQFYDADVNAHVIDSNEILYRVADGDIYVLAA